MLRKSLLSLAFFGALAGLLPSAGLARDPAPSTPHHGRYGIDRDMLRNASPEERDVLRDLRRLEMLYLREGLAKQLPAVYQDVLGKTQNATVLAVANARLQRLQAPRPDAAETIARVRQKLDSDLEQLR